MSKKPNSKSDLTQSDIYQIQVKGHLDHHWSDWFEGMTIRQNEDGTTLIVGPVIDDAALHGLLKKVRDSGLRLLSVNRVETDQEEVDIERSSDSFSDQQDKKEGAA